MKHPSELRGTGFQRYSRIPEIDISRHDVTLPGLPVELAGTTIVQLSDFHRGCGNTDELIEAAVTLANNLEADYIVLTGDFINQHRRDVLPAVKMTARLRARRGVFAVLGNHDYRGDPVLLSSALETASIAMLTNRAIRLSHNLWLSGIDDMEKGEPDLAAALCPIPEEAAAILLSHNPEVIDIVPEGRPILILSGHTHGAQIRVRAPSPESICRRHLGTRYAHGWYYRSAVKMYVNRGIGVTGPWPLNRRHNCPPEIAVFSLLAVP